MVGVKLAEHGFVVVWAACFCNNHSMLLADAVQFTSGDVQSFFSQAHALDANRGLLVDAVAYGPLNDAEVDSVFLTSIQTQVEGLGVEQVTLQADGEAL